MDWSTVVTITATVAATRGYLWMKSVMAQPYRWQCPACGFKLSMNASGIFEEIKDDHIRKFHDPTLPHRVRT